MAAKAPLARTNVYFSETSSVADTLTLIVSPGWVAGDVFVINVAVVIYLLFAKRLFGLRGGAAADAAEGEIDQGWEALERTAPPPAPAPAAAS